MKLKAIFHIILKNLWLELEKKKKKKKAGNQDDPPAAQIENRVTALWDCSISL